MKLAHPLLLLAFLPLALLLWRFYAGNSSKQERRRLLFLAAATASLVIALANPFWRTRPVQRVIKGAELIVILDVSQSMFCAVDGSRTRLDQARDYLRVLLPQFSGSPVSLIYFAGDAQIGCPLTTDLQAIYSFLDSITPAMTAAPGTKSAPLVQTLDAILQDRAASISTKPLGLLFSDGEFFDATGELENWLRQRPNFQLFTFGGERQQKPVPKFDLSGPYPAAVSEVQTEQLRQLGTFFSLAADPEGSRAQVLRQIHDVISSGEEEPDYQPFPFLAAAFFLLLIYQLYSGIPRIPLLVASLRTAMLIFVVVSLSMKSDDKTRLFTEAMRDAGKKDYDNALKKLTELQKESASEQIDIAIGNIYFDQMKPDEAIRHYRKAIARNPAGDTARWNWEVALKRQSQPKDESNRPRQPVPKEAPDESSALLRYYEHLEKEQLRLTNSVNANTNKFAW